MRLGALNFVDVTLVVLHVSRYRARKQRSLKGTSSSLKHSDFIESTNLSVTEFKFGLRAGRRRHVALAAASTPWIR
jgi:hypothetical protein